MPRKKSDPDEAANPLLSEHLRTQQEIKPWDVFKDPPIKVETGSMEESKWLDFLEKVFKLLAYLVTFIIVLGGAVISKGTLLFMTSQIVANQTKPYCNARLGINQQFVVQLPVVERVEWMWIIIFTFFIPELGSFIRSLRICLFKTWRMPSFSEFFSLILTESLPTIGSALLVFCILPNLDVVKGVMLTNAVCFIPAVIGFISRDPKEPVSILKMSLDIISIIAQATSFVVWPIIEDRPSMWLIPVSVILISCGWWENYVSEDSPLSIINHLGKSKKSFENSRYFSYLFISLWKCLLFLVTAIIILWVTEGSIDFLFENFEKSFKEHNITIMEVKPIITDQADFNIRDVVQFGGSTTTLSDPLTPVWVFLINIGATYLCYVFGKFACRISIQGFSYAFPINLSVPLIISLLIILCGLFNGDECAFTGSIPPYLFFNSPPVYFLHDFVASQHSWIWLLWLLSQTWITMHIWTPTREKLARTEKLYVRPMYDAFLIDQSIAMNRRRDHKPEKLVEDAEDSDSDNGLADQNTSKENENDQCQTSRVYACGTMWHETKEEMMEFLKSIMRLDEDQCARRLVKDELEYPLSDYYELETHVFFDDAFVRMHANDNDPRVNEYVKILVMAVDDAASEVHQARIKIRPPKKYITPYGGRLVWTLPGKTKMIAHLKDKKKIRPKKRWSQVMYMYYLLGHKLMENESLTPKQKDIVAENTYLLALDGDIDFQPDAVRRLIDLMKKNKALGAACGRIHPLGSGPMVWYQMFEYAIGHWLQKATEHVIGCVLCSPGCFSLFRAKALMDDSVMRKYTTRSEEARHFVQYDQGEDRWLCTLLLQRGYRVEYSAASDAFTHCPEGFNEFYNQRRRWMPSTTANILDLLMDYKRTIKINDNISRLYVLYQIILMVGTILGPGTIFLMLVGAFVAAFQMDQWSSFLWNVIPILVFMSICILFKSDIQLLFAGIISGIYGLVMMAVLVGVMLQISSDGFLAPSSLFFFCVAGEMIITALLHPKEFNCLVYGIVYYVTVPSMYMLLVIYSVFNLNNISWGTREVTVAPKAPTELKEDADKQKEEPKKKKQNKIMSLFGDKNKDESGTFEFSIGGLFKCLWCTHRKNGDENIELLRINDNLQQLMGQMHALERSVNHQPDNINEINSLQQQRRTTILEGARGKEISFMIKDDSSDSESDKKSLISDTIEPNNWLEEEELGHGEYDCISTKERVFWEGLLNRYLHPIEDNKEKVAKDLKDLRDKSVMAFFMLNAIFVLVVFLLTLKKDMLHINWPLDVKVNFTYLDDVREIQMEKQYLELEPIGFVFLIFFAALLVVQFIAMLYHRFGTFSQILANTYINWSITKFNKKNLTEDEILARDPVKIVKEFCRIKGAEDEEEEEEEERKEAAPGRRKTVKHLAETGDKKQSVHDLDEAFKRRTTRYLRNPTVGGKNAVARKSMAVAVNQRRKTVHMRRDSHLPHINTTGGYVNNGYDAKEENNF